MFQPTVAVVEEIPLKRMLERIGATVSGVPVVKVRSPDVTVLPEASLEITR